MNKPKIAIDDIAKNDFSIICTYLASGIILEAEKRKGYDINKNNYHLFSDKEKFILDSFYILSNINDCLSSIEYACMFMKRFYGKDYYKNHQINIVNYSLYHYDVFCYKISTLKDLYFKLVNHLYSLNLKERACTWDNIKKKEVNINNSFLFSMLRQNYEFLSFIDKRRNKSAHEGEIKHKAFESISPYVALTMYADKIPSGIGNGAIITRGSWLELELKASRKLFLEEVEVCRYNSFTFTRCILCSLSDRFNSMIDKGIKEQYSEKMEKAIEVIVKNRNCINNAHLESCPNSNIIIPNPKSTE